ncbi:MAG TPA: hypothetical protein VNQ33_08525 [Acidimicrobiales bacterium]|nr:hypothetical protein [Acidimicrobiales bacterium]
MEQMTGTSSAGSDARFPDKPRTKLRKRLELSWVISIVAFTLARFFVARETLEQYGLNIWVFGFIDLITAIPYAVGTARVVGALVDRDLTGASKWAGIAAVSFFAPYAYILWAGSEDGATFPTSVYVVLGVLIAIFGANAVWGVVRKVRTARAAAHAAAV